MVFVPIEQVGSNEAARRPLRAEECALAVIDIQEKLLPSIWEKERVVRNSQVLVRMAAAMDIPVVVTAQYTKGLGPIVPEIAFLLPETTPIEKLEFGCFGSDAFCSTIGKLAGRNTLLVCGIEAHICVMQTALGALNQSMNVHVATDAVSSRTELNWQLGLGRMRDAGAVISSTEMMLYELMRKSGTPVFKEMLRWVK